MGGGWQGAGADRAGGSIGSVEGAGDPMLRHELALLRRRPSRPPFRPADRVLLAAISQALHAGRRRRSPSGPRRCCARIGNWWRAAGMGLIACHYRAAEWRHKEIELAAHELLQYLDDATA